MDRNKAKLLGRLATAALAAAAVLLVSRTAMFRFLESKTGDYRFIVRDTLRTPSPKSPIVIVGIDARALEKYPDPIALNEALMRAIENVSRAGARVVGFDVLHLSAVDPSRCDYKPGVFLNTIVRSRRLTVPYYLMKDDVGMPVYVTELMSAAMGLEQAEINGFPSDAKLKLLDAAGKMLPVSFGYANLSLDPDGTAREAAPARKHGGEALTSFALAIYLRWAGREASDVRVGRNELRIGNTAIPAPGGRMPINYAAPPGGYPHVSLADVAAGGGGSLKRLFGGKVVLIGAYDLRVQDFHPTPYYRSRLGATNSMFGVEIAANTLDTMINRRFITRAPSWASAAVVVAACLLAVFLLIEQRLWKSLPALAALMFGWAAAAQYAFSAHSFRVDFMAVEAALPLAFLMGHLHNTFVLDRQKRFIQRVLGSYLDPRIVNELAERGDARLLEGTRREITVLFTDIRSFTTLSEKLEPEEVVDILNVHLSTLSDVIMRSGGMVDKYVGDAIMAIWNAPNDVPGHRLRACETALKMQAAMEGVNRRLADMGVRLDGELRIGIGVNTGFAVVGNIGSEMKSDYTAIGDTVNVASRLEGLNKNHGTGIIISETTAEGIRERLELRELGAAPVKGRNEPVKIFELKAVV